MNFANIYLWDSLESIEPRLNGAKAQCCITSPPYWGLRDYESKTQLGQENTYQEYIDNLVKVFNNIKNVLKDDGTLWVNIGDTYVGTGNKGAHKDPKNPKGRNGQTIALNNKVEGLPSKNMIGIPWHFAFEMQKSGWILRSDIIWEKPNAMPSPVKDRPISSYEHIFLFSKKQKYYYNWESVQENSVNKKGKRRQRDVWHINTTSFKGAHFAVFPEELVKPCVLAGSKTNDIIIDPFSGSGTTGVVSLKNERNYIGLESNQKYVELSQKRIDEAIQTPINRNWQKTTSTII